jgi:hypothetical protein
MLPLLVGVAFPLQLLGYSGTCTQDDTDSFVAGAVLSGPILFLTILVLFLDLRRFGSVPKVQVFVVNLPLLILSSAILLLNLELLTWIIWEGISACGPDHANTREDVERENIIIGLTYGTAPLSILLMSSILVYKALKAKRGS